MGGVSNVITVSADMLTRSLILLTYRVSTVSNVITVSTVSADMLTRSLILLVYSVLLAAIGMAFRFLNLKHPQNLLSR